MNQVAKNLRIAIKTYTVFIFMLAFSGFVNAQEKKSFIMFQKIGKNYQKKLKLPVSLRCVTYNEEEARIIKLDSIVANVLYGNNGMDSINLNQIRIIHVRGITEIAKGTFATASLAIAASALWFALYAASGQPVATHTNSRTFVLPALAYTTVFSGIGILILSRPKTRFNLKHYQVYQ